MGGVQSPRFALNCSSTQESMLKKQAREDDIILISFLFFQVFFNNVKVSYSF